MGYNPLYRYLSDEQIVSDLANEEPLNLASVSFWHVPSFWALPVCWCNKIIQAPYVLSLPQPWSQPVLQEAPVHLVGNRTYSQYPGARCACCYWGVTAPRPSQWNIGVCVHTHLHLFSVPIYTFIYLEHMLTYLSTSFYVPSLLARWLLSFRRTMER